jgi:hypothetical protein
LKIKSTTKAQSMKSKIKYLLVLVLASFVFAGCETAHESKAWEYKSVYSNNTDADKTKLNGLGKEGWQLVSVVPASVNDSSNGDLHSHDLNTALYIFKRPLH